jgi:hypothetical protein
MPIARSSVLLAHVLTSLIANFISLVVVVLVALLIGFRSGAGVLAWLAVAGILILFTLALTWIAVIPGLTAKSADGRERVLLPTTGEARRVARCLGGEVGVGDDARTGGDNGTDGVDNGHRGLHPRPQPARLICAGYDPVASGATGTQGVGY